MSGKEKPAAITEAELHAYQDVLVRAGLEDSRKGRVVSHEKVLERLKRRGRASDEPKKNGAL